MEVLFKEEAIGKIEGAYREEFWIHGKFTPYKSYTRYKEFLDALVCEDGMNEIQFEEELFDESNWFVKSKDGIKGICIPAIYEDGDTSIRYR